VISYKQCASEYKPQYHTTQL